jgi:hypothetical protein
MITPLRGLPTVLPSSPPLYGSYTRSQWSGSHRIINGRLLQPSLRYQKGSLQLSRAIGFDLGEATGSGKLDLLTGSQDTI